VVSGGLHVFGDALLEGEHARGVEVARSGYQIALVVVFRRELKPDEVAAVVELLAFDEIVFGGVPAGGLDAPNVAAGLRGHGVEPDAGHGCAASPQLIERGVFFEAAESRSLDLLGGEGGLVFVDVRVRRALERGHARENVCGRVLLGGFAGRRDRVA